MCEHSVMASSTGGAGSPGAGPGNPGNPVTLGTGPPETILHDEPSNARSELSDALSLPSAADRRAAVAVVVADHPRFLAGWAELGEIAELAGSHLEAYAYFRVGYHRGLDALRASGWRGSGFVRWIHPSNRPFLRCVDGLRRMATAIGEADEEERCQQFLRQLDPQWDRRFDAGG